MVNLVVCSTIGVVIGLALVVLGPILGYVVFPPVVKQTIIDSIVLKEGTEQFERWEKLPQPLDFKVYIFNVTNPQQVQDGETPIVKELGPYVYSQYRQKYNIRYSADRESVSYYQKQLFFFNSEASAPFKEDDPIVVLNMHMNSVLQILSSQIQGSVRNMRQSINSTLDRIPVVNVIKRFIERVTPVQSIIQLVEEESAIVLRILNSDIKKIFGPDTNSFFLSTTPKEFLFDGVEFCRRGQSTMVDVTCDQIEARKVQTIRRTETGSLKFSFFHFKNNTHDGLYEINTGKEHVSRLLDIESLNGRPTIKTWRDNPDGTKSKCNMINGTDATQSPPFRKEGDDFHIFSTDICRSVHLHFEKKTNYQGIPGFRYETRADFLNEIDPKYNTECFCVNRIFNGIVRPNGCLYSGALDLSNCLGAPVVLTLPHLMGASEEYTRGVEGLQPDREKHQIFMEVEPRTGSPLRGGKRVQFNMFLRKIQNIDLSRKFHTLLMPVLWVDEGVELNDEMVNMLKDQLINVLLILEILQWTILALGVVVILSIGLWYYCRRKRLSCASVEPIIASKST